MPPPLEKFFQMLRLLGVGGHIKNAIRKKFFGGNSGEPQTALKPPEKLRRDSRILLDESTPTTLEQGIYFKRNYFQNVDAFTTHTPKLS